MTIGFDIPLSSHTRLPVAELSRAIAAALRQDGSDARLVHDRLPAVREDRATVVISPHDVLPHLAIGDRKGLTAALTRSVLVCCEHPATPGWEADVGYGARAGSLLHVSDPGVAAFRELGLPAHRFRLGHHEALGRAGGGDEPRSIDVAFIGSRTQRREQIIASAADVLSEHDVDLRLTDGVATAQTAIRNFINGPEKQELLARTRIVLNLHWSDDSSFEWLRALDALCNGAVLVSEESLGAAPLEPGRHFLSGTPRSLPFLIDVLLREPDRIEAIRGEAYELVRDQHPLRRSVETLVEIADALPMPAPPGRNFAVAPPDVPAVSATPEAPVPDPGMDASPEGPDQVTRMLTRQDAVLKKLFFDLRLLRRQVAHLSHTVEDPGAPMVEVTTSPTVAHTRPEVSVVVTVHNYARYVREALLSARRSRDVKVEIVVVDDASIDGSADVVRAFMDEHPDIPITLLQHRVNTGVQRARNRAFSHARAPFAFVLDADNVVYPRGIAKLRDALSRDPTAAFAYGLIERFGEGGSDGLMGIQSWDPALLAQEPYIDAMALIRVEAFKQVGGYVTDPLLELGWEDYDLWLSFAVAGLHGAHVREVIGRYRVHGVSSLTMTTLDTEELMAKLRQRHAPFFEASTEAV